MAFEIIREVLGWCAVMNVGFLLCWWFIVKQAHDFVYGTHGGLFKLSEERVSEIHYTFLLFFKLCIILFNIVPYSALCIVD